MKAFILKSKSNSIIYVGDTLLDVKQEAADVGGSYSDIRIEEWNGAHLLRRYAFSALDERWDVRHDFVDETRRDLEDAERRVQDLHTKLNQMMEES